MTHGALNFLALRLIYFLHCIHVIVWTPVSTDSLKNLLVQSSSVSRHKSMWHLHFGLTATVSIRYSGGRKSAEDKSKLENSKMKKPHLVFLSLLAELFISHFTPLFPVRLFFLTYNHNSECVCPHKRALMKSYM